MNNRKKCFVIMPVSRTNSCTEDEWTGIFEHMIKPAVTGSRLGFECERAKPRTGAFIKDILEGLNRADVVIADLTDRNPNVCYELGIRHTLKKRTILIAQNIDAVPSDLQPYWVITYEKDLTGADKLKRRIREILRKMQKNPEKPDSPVADFLEVKHIEVSSIEKSATVKKLNALISELSRNLDRATPIIKRARKNRRLRKENKQGVAILSDRFEITALELLLSTYYIALPETLLEKAIVLLNTLKDHNSGLDLWQNNEFEEAVERRIIDDFPQIKRDLRELFKNTGQIRLSYINDNYEEPKIAPLILSSPQHQKYVSAK